MRGGAITTTRPTVEIDGDLGPDYLRQALRRAGVEIEVGDVDVKTLSGGRTGARVDRLTSGTESFVLKRARLDTWQRAAIANPGEGPLWLSGAMDSLPAPLECPVIDAAFHAASDSWWILMRDVSAGIPPRGGFGEAETRTLWRSMARLHAAYWGKDAALEALPMVDVAATTTLFAEPIGHAAGGQVRENWVPRVIEEFTPLRVLLPVFLELLAPGDAEFYVNMTQDREWHRGLDNATPTLLHGDLRRANIAFIDDKVILFDWEFASRGPAACDLQWSAFLAFWAYTPDDGRQPWQRDHLRASYLEELETCIGAKIDRDEFQKTWDLGWLRIVSQLGFCFADADLDDPGERVAAVGRATAGIQWCRRILDG
jgi:hypothetical protein